jgi:hypothetical protein
VSLSSWWRTQRILRARKKADRNSDAPLREFVYLDEVSVYSLIASRRGALATEFTDSETASLRAELGGNVSGNAGVLKGSISSKMEQARSQSSQVVRKSTVQSTFKSLYDSELARLPLRPARDVHPTPPPFLNSEGLKASLLKPEYDGWLKTADGLARGDLVELEVELQADSLFQVTTVVSTLVEIMNESGSLIPDFEQSQLSDATTLHRVLDRILAGLIPVRGVAIDFFVVSEADGQSYVVHESMLRGSQLSAETSVTPLIVTGVLEGQLFWKDFRQVLFSSSRYTLLCRILTTGLQSEWQPLKVVDLVGSAIPGFAESLSQLGDGALMAMAQAAQTPKSDAPNWRRQKAIRTYGYLLADAYGVELSQDDEQQLEAISQQANAESGDIKDLRRQFNPVVEYLTPRIDSPIDPLRVAQLRSAAMLDAGLTFDGRAENDKQLPGRPASSDNGATYLDTEIVAIYW